MRGQRVRVTAGLLKGAVAEVVRQNPAGSMLLKLVGPCGAYKDGDTVNVMPHDVEVADGQAR